MNGIAVLIALAAGGVDYGWQPAKDGQLEYIIQVEPVTLYALAEGQDIVSQIDPYVRNVRRFRIRVGNDLVPRVGSPPRIPPPLPDEQPPAGVNFGWQSLGSGGAEFIIQILPQRLQSLRSGEQISGVIPATQASLQQIRIVSNTAALPGQTASVIRPVSGDAVPPPNTAAPRAGSAYAGPQPAERPPGGERGSLRESAGTAAGNPASGPNPTAAGPAGPATPQPTMEFGPPAGPPWQPVPSLPRQDPPAWNGSPAAIANQPAGGQPPSVPASASNSPANPVPPPAAPQGYAPANYAPSGYAPQGAAPGYAPPGPQLPGNPPPTQGPSGWAPPGPLAPGPSGQSALPPGPAGPSPGPPGSGPTGYFPQGYAPGGYASPGYAPPQDPRGGGWQPGTPAAAIAAGPSWTGSQDLPGRPVPGSANPSFGRPLSPYDTQGWSSVGFQDGDPSEAYAEAVDRHLAGDGIGLPPSSMLGGKQPRPLDFWESLARTAEDPDLAYLRPDGDAEKPWWPLSLAMLALFASIGANLYIGWIAVGIYRRYLDVAAYDEPEDPVVDDDEEAGDRRRGERRRREHAVADAY